MGDILASIDDLVAQVTNLSDRELGGPAAAAARINVRRVADYLLGLHNSRQPLPRHAGKPSSGKIAVELSKSGGNFNRQNFFTNQWCGKLLELYDSWELSDGLPRLDAAAAASEAKQVRDERLDRLEEQLLIAQAEARQLRQEVAFLRGFVASTGRMP